MALFSFKKSDDIEKFVVGADADMGGPSEGYFALTNRNTGMSIDNFYNAWRNWATTHVGIREMFVMISRILTPLLSHSFFVSFISNA